MLSENGNKLIPVLGSRVLSQRACLLSAIFTAITVLTITTLTLILTMATGLNRVWAQPPPMSVAEKSFETPLQFGLLPYISTRKLFTYYLPLKQYLERTLGRPVRMSTAPDFATYIKRAEEGSYDLYHTAPHFAALAEQAYGYRRVSQYRRVLEGSILVARESDIKKATDLRGSTLLTPDSLAIITFLGEQWLRDNGMQPGVDVKVKNTPSHNNAILAVMHGEADAAVTASNVFETMLDETRERLRILGKTQRVPNVMFMSSPRLSDTEYRQLRQAMLSFTAKGAGKEFFAKTGYVDMVEITDNDMQSLIPFVIQLNNKFDMP